MSDRVKNMNVRRAVVAVVVLLLPLAAAACGGGGNEPSAAASGAGAVEVADNEFQPDVTEVAVGEEVTWTFTGAVNHNITGDGFTSRTMKSGVFRHRFTERGTYEYVCTLHPGMTGEVRVTDG